MMKKYLFLVIGYILLGDKLYAQPDKFDIYGVDVAIQNQIISCCSNDINEYLHKVQMINSSTSAATEKSLMEKDRTEKQLLTKINKLGHFYISKISTIYYPDNKQVYSTLDLVQASDTIRQPYTSIKRVKREIKQDQGLKDLFLVWNQYNETNIELIHKNNVDLKSKSCPVIHCTWGFDKHELKVVLPKLKSGVTRYKTRLIDIIKYSNNDSDREKAIFILAHDENYHELAKLLINYTNDPDDIVRNNSMRVLGAILSKHVIQGFDIHRILLALNYPYVTDRNKAAYILWDIVRQDKATHQVVIKDSGVTLINLLKLKQPNNHELAYLILKEISHQNYSEYDYQSWQNWLDLQNNKK